MPQHMPFVDRFQASNTGRTPEFSDKLAQLGLLNIADTGLSPAQRSMLTTLGSREIGTQSRLLDALLQRRFAGSPGTQGTAFGDALVAQSAQRQQQALTDLLGNIDRTALDRQMQALQTLFQGESGQAARQFAGKEAERSRRFGALSQAGQGVGQGVGESGILQSISGRKFKKNIRPASIAKLLKAVRGAEVKNFEFKGGNENHVGVIADEAPTPMKVNNQMISLPDAIGMLIGAIQALDKKIEALA
jgi:hypothetical protein